MRTRIDVPLLSAITLAACTTMPSREPARSRNATTTEVVIAAEGTREEEGLEIEPPPPPRTPPRPPCEDSAEPGAPLLSLGTHGTHGMEFSETTLVTCDGRVTVRAMMPFSSSEAGEYALRLDRDEIERARAIALGMIRAPDATLALPPQGVDTLAVAHSDPAVSGRADTSAAHAAAFAWLGQVRERAERHPEYTVTLSVLGHRETSLAIRIANRGRRRSSFRVDAQGSRASWAGGSAGVTGSLVVEEHPTGASMSSRGIEPGGHVVLGLTLDAAPPPDATVAVTLAGYVDDEGYPVEVRLRASEGAR